MSPKECVMARRPARERVTKPIDPALPDREKIIAAYAGRSAARACIARSSGCYDSRRDGAQERRDEIRANAALKLNRECVSERSP